MPGLSNLLKDKKNTIVGQLAGVPLATAVPPSVPKVGGKADLKDLILPATLGVPGVGETAAASKVGNLIGPQVGRTALGAAGAAVPPLGLALTADNLLGLGITDTLFGF